MPTIRPWVTPTEVKNYSDFPQVQERADAKLLYDIRKAENDIIKYLNRDFTEIDPETELPYYDDIPEDVKMATVLLAESIAMSAIDEGKAQGMKSESFDDYSYTRGSADDNIGNLGLSSTLCPYILEKASGNTTVMKIRRL